MNHRSIRSIFALSLVIALALAAAAADDALTIGPLTVLRGEAEIRIYSRSGKGRRRDVDPRDGHPRAREGERSWPWWPASMVPNIPRSSPSTG